MPDPGQHRPAGRRLPARDRLRRLRGDDRRRLEAAPPVPGLRPRRWLERRPRPAGRPLPGKAPAAGGGGVSAELDRDEFWARTMAEVASRPPAPEVDPLPVRSAPFADGYGVKLTCGLGDYRLFAYYSVPKSPGPHPAIYHAPGYASAVQVPPYEERRRHAVLSLCARGQRLSDRPFAAAYPGLLTHEIEDPERYPFRGIVGDACRGVDFLRLRSEVDRGRIVVVGGDTALFVAIFRPEVRAAVVADPFFPSLLDLAG